MSSVERYSASRTQQCFAKDRCPINNETLREHAFFKDRDPKLFELLVESVQVKVFLQGDTIIKEGEEGSTMYFLRRGSVAILIGPEEKQVAKLEDGSLFGELALLGNGKRACTVRALDVCDCRVVDADAFHLALQRFPMERAYFYELAKERCKELNKEAPKTLRPVTAPTAPRSKAAQRLRRASAAVTATIRAASLANSARRNSAPASCDELGGFKSCEVTSVQAPLFSDIHEVEPVEPTLDNLACGAGARRNSSRSIFSKDCGILPTQDNRFADLLCAIPPEHGVQEPVDCKRVLNMKENEVAKNSTVARKMATTGDLAAYIVGLKGGHDSTRPFSPGNPEPILPVQGDMGSYRARVREATEKARRRAARSAEGAPAEHRGHESRRMNCAGYIEHLPRVRDSTRKLEADCTGPPRKASKSRVLSLNSHRRFRSPDSAQMNDEFWEVFSHG